MSSCTYVQLNYILLRAVFANQLRTFTQLIFAKVSKLIFSICTSYTDCDARLQCYLVGAETPDAMLHSFCPILFTCLTIPHLLGVTSGWFSQN